MIDLFLFFFAAAGIFFSLRWSMQALHDDNVVLYLNNYSLGLVYSGFLMYHLFKFLEFVLHYS